MFVDRQKHYKFEAELAMKSWKIEPREIHRFIPGGKFRGSMYSLGRRNSQITVVSEDAMSLYDGRQQFIQTAMYKGNKVAIKNLSKKIEQTRSNLLELKREEVVNFCDHFDTAETVLNALLRRISGERNLRIQIKRGKSVHWGEEEEKVTSSTEADNATNRRTRVPEVPGPIPSGKTLQGVKKNQPKGEKVSE
ncbi:hypothetical protein PGB90_000241 [Kerria lacca]